MPVLKSTMSSGPDGRKPRLIISLISLLSPAEPKKSGFPVSSMFEFALIDEAERERFLRIRIVAPVLKAVADGASVSAKHRLRTWLRYKTLILVVGNEEDEEMVDATIGNCFTTLTGG